MNSRAVTFALLALTGLVFWRAGFHFGEDFARQTDTLLSSRAMVEYRTAQDAFDASAAPQATGFVYLGPGKWWLERPLLIRPNEEVILQGAGFRTMIR